MPETTVFLVRSICITINVNNYMDFNNMKDNILSMLSSVIRRMLLAVERGISGWK